MAIQRNNLLMYGTSGSIGRQVTFKQYNSKTVVAHYPDMSKVVYTKAQLAERIRFRLAVAYARTVIADPVKKRAYTSKKHFSAYHAAIADYLNTSKAAEKQQIKHPDLKNEDIRTSLPVSSEIIPLNEHPLIPTKMEQAPS